MSAPGSHRCERGSRKFQEGTPGASCSGPRDPGETALVRGHLTHFLTFALPLCHLWDPRKRSHLAKANALPRPACLAPKRAHFAENLQIPSFARRRHSLWPACSHSPFPPSAAPLFSVNSFPSPDSRISLEPQLRCLPASPPSRPGTFGAPQRQAAATKGLIPEAGRPSLRARWEARLPPGACWEG